MSDALRNGRFVIVGSLGEGTQGHTFDGVDKREGRAVAIKRFDVRTARTWKDAELAERETRVLQTLSHPKLPRYRDHFEENGALYLVMDKIEGESLAALQKRGALLTEDEAIRLLREASDVLEYLHGRTPPVIHRDLKPGNVIRMPDGSFSFVDFGAVRDKLRPEGGSTVVGTFGYMAPEQFQGRALPASDVYAIGATALSMLTGLQPEALPHKGLAIDVRSALRGRATAPLVAALACMVDPDPDRRPNSIAPMLPRLERQPARERRSSPGGEPKGGDIRNELGARFAQFVRHAEEYEARARDYERRAEIGGSGAAGWLRGAEAWRSGAMKWREAAERHALHTARAADRKARRKARKEARRSGRASRRRATGDNRAASPIALVFGLAFTVGIVAVALATQVVVPLVLRFLAVFFASRVLRSAAGRVREAGASAVSEMGRSRRWFLGTSLDSVDGRAVDVETPNGPVDPSRVAGDSPGPRVRVASRAEEDRDGMTADEQGDSDEIGRPLRR